MTVVGGLRARFVSQSVHLAVDDILDRLHWYDEVDGRQTVNLLPKPARWDEAVPLNTVAIEPGRLPPDNPFELGSSLATVVWTFFVYFFAENESTGLHLINDLRDAFQGKMPSIGYGSPFIDVLNFLEATPSVLYRAEVTSCTSDTPPPSSGRPWANDLHVLVLELEDMYGSEDDE